MVAQFSRFSTNHLSAHFKRVGFMISKLYLNKAANFQEREGQTGQWTVIDSHRIFTWESTPFLSFKASKYVDSWD